MNINAIPSTIKKDNEQLVNFISVEIVELLQCVPKQDDIEAIEQILKDFQATFINRV